MISVAQSILNRSVFSTYNKWSQKLCRRFCNVGSFKIVKYLSFLNPDWKMYFRCCKVQMIDTFENVEKLYQVSRPVYAAKPQYDFCSYPLEQVKEFDVSIYHLRDVKIVGQSDMIHFNENLSIFEQFSSEKNENFCFLESRTLMKIQDEFVSKFRKSKQVIEQGILLSGRYSGNYYHLVCEILSRFYHLGNIDLDPVIPLIVDKVVYDIPQFKELLGYFNVDKRAVVCIENGYQYDVKSLYYTPNANFIPPDFIDFQKANYTDCFFDVVSLKFLRQTMLQNISTRQFAKRIFLSRKNASHRNISNDIEVTTLLEQYGFEIVHPEQHSVSDQISMFYGAELIIGASGAALTNLVVCQESCRILCLTSNSLDLSVFSTIVKVIGADLQYIFTGDSHGMVHEDFHVNIERFERIVIEWLERGEG